jgi:YD repeat-containing protein
MRIAAWCAAVPALLALQRAAHADDPRTVTVSVVGTEPGSVYFSGDVQSGSCAPGQVCTYVVEAWSTAYVSAEVFHPEGAPVFTGCAATVWETSGDCWFTVDQDVAITVSLDGPPPREHSLPIRAGAPKPWEDLGMWDPSGEHAVSPNGNLLNRIPLFGWSPVGDGRPIAVTLYHNAADAAVQRGAGWGFRLGVAAALQIGGDGAITITEPDGTPRIFTPVAGGFRAEPFDRGRLTLVGATYHLDEGGGRIRRFTAPNGLGRVETSRIDRLGLVTTFTYDAQDRITAVTDPTGRSATFTLVGGVYTAFVGPTGSTVLAVYADGELRNLQGPVVDGATPNLALGYVTDDDGRHLIASRTSWGGGTAASPITGFTYYYDGSIQTLSHPDGTLHRFDYHDGRVSLTDNLGRTSSIAFWRGAVLEGVEPSGRSVYFARDDRQRPILIVDGNGHQRRYEWDASDRIVRSWDPADRMTSFAYDARGNVTSTTTPGGLVTTRTYNAFDQVVTTTDPLGRTATYVRDAAGNVLQYVDFAGVVRATATYNAHGLPTSETDAYGRTRSTTYDAHGNWLSKAGPDGTSSRVLANSFGRVASATDALGETTTFTYDTLGRQRTATDADGTVTRSFDLDGRMTAVTDDRGPNVQSATRSYTPSHAIATRNVNNNPIQTAPAQIVMDQNELPPAACTPTCGNRCGTDLPDSCGGHLSCACSGGLVCSASGYCVQP